MGVKIWRFSQLPDTIRFSETFDASAAELMAAVRSNGLGVVAKRRDKPGRGVLLNCEKLRIGSHVRALLLSRS
jgi:hypothetical protein